MNNKYSSNRNKIFSILLLLYYFLLLIIIILFFSGRASLPEEDFGVIVHSHRYQALYCAEEKIPGTAIQELSWKEVRMKRGKRGDA